MIPNYAVISWSILGAAKPFSFRHVAADNGVVANGQVTRAGVSIDAQQLPC